MGLSAARPGGCGWPVAKPGRAPGMGAKQEVKVLWGPRRREPHTEGTRALGRSTGPSGTVRTGPRSVPRGGVWWKSKVQCCTERKRSAVRRQSAGESAVSDEALFPSGGPA